MNHRLLIYSLVMLFVAGTSDSWSQESVKTAHRRESLIDLFQQRLCGILCDCHQPMKTGHHADVKKAALQKAPVQKAPVQKAPVQKAPVQRAPVQRAPVQRAPVQRAPVQKAPVQKAPVQKGPVQKGLCRREVSDMEVACESCCPARARPVADMMPRWTGTLPQIFPRLAETPSSKGGKSTVKSDAVQRSSKAYHCRVDSPVQVDSPTPQLLPIPKIEKPQIDANPFEDDALKPAPSPRAGIRQATDLSTPGREDPMANSTHQPIVRQSVHYNLLLHLD